MKYTLKEVLTNAEVLVLDDKIICYFSDCRVLPDERIILWSIDLKNKRHMMWENPKGVIRKGVVVG